MLTDKLWQQTLFLLAELQISKTNFKMIQESDSENSKLEYSFLKEVYIELIDYNFFHGPSFINQIDDRFRGRKLIENKLYKILNTSKVKSGAYLITGYRGVGKTSLVNKVLAKLVFKEKSKKKKFDAPIVIKLNLGQDELEERALLNVVAKALYDNYQSWYSKPIAELLKRLHLLISTFLLLVFVKLIIIQLVEVILNFLLSEVILNDLYEIFKIKYSIWVVSFFVAYQIARLFFYLLPSHYLTTNKNALAKLKFLNERIDAELIQESGVLVGKEKLGFSSSKKKAFPIADSKEIEIELLNIFRYIEKIQSIRKPKFIFVFDELDKIEAHQKHTILEKEEIAINSSGYSTSAELSRKRQQAIAKILANLKHFFTTARAKFIFIAGREMYDATLADISDRNYFLGSIFHDVIYVNSFLTEDPEELYKGKKTSSDEEKAKHTSYYHSMVEEFVCQFLMPKEFELENCKLARLDNPEKINESSESRKSISLKTYNLYLQKHAENLDEKKIKRVILMLNQFITYLAHRSSGSPKKLTHLFETYICKNSESLQDNERNEYHEVRSIIAKREVKEKEKKTEKFFLHFDYYSQYTFGLINYLTVPYYYNISRYVKRYSDKLMVSTGYLIDHLYKFHEFGFSWRNLEVTPEIIDVNKAPTLRSLIEDIVNFLSYNHLQHVVSGLFDFKFKKKLAYEINFLSKVSERESAALNFTLDESQEVKGHFLRKLEQLNKEYKDLNYKKYIHSKGYLMQSLGDLHYYDQEYDDASVMYKDAVQMITNEPQGLPLRLLIIFCRIMLKMGLTFERKKAFASALMTYMNLSNLVLKSVEIDLKNIQKEKIKKGQNIVIKDLSKKDEDKSEFGINYFDDLMNQPLYSTTHLDILKSYTVETIRLIFQPFLAKLYVLDKEKIGGLTDYDIENTLKEISFLTKIASEQVEERILSEYHSKIGDLLFSLNYNSSLKNPPQRKVYEDKHRIYTDEYFYLLSLQFLGGQKFYVEKQPLFNLIFKFLAGVRELRFDELKMLAANLSDFGDSQISGPTPEIFDLKSVIKILDYAEDIENNIHNIKELCGINRTNLAITCFLLSSYFYLLNDDNSKSCFQAMKVLHVIEISLSKSRDIQTEKKSEEQCFKENQEKGSIKPEEGENVELFNNETILKSIKKFVSGVLISIHRSYNSSTRQEIERIREIFKYGKYLDESNYHYILNNIPSYGEIQELLMLYSLLELRFGEELKSGNHTKILSKYNPSKYSNLNSMFSRLNSLYVKMRCNYMIFSEHKFNQHLHDLETILKKVKTNEKAKGELSEIWNERIKDHELLQYLISDSIYCFTESIRILKVFGVNPLANHSTYGFVYEKRAEWCRFFNIYDDFERNQQNNLNPSSEPYNGTRIQNSNSIYMKVRLLIGSQAMPNLNENYNYEKAVFHYTQAIETHEGKFSFDRMVENLYYLEDDYNDIHLHFFTALERYKIAQQNIQFKLNNCKQKLNKSRIYQTKFYFDKSV